MTWARFDDRYDDNPKIRRAWRMHPRAVGLHAMAVTYCARNETDGHVESLWLDEKLPNKRERDSVLGALQDCGLFIPDPRDGFWIKDYLEFNPSAAQIKAKRNDKSDAGKKGAQARWGKQDANSNGMAGAMAGANSSDPWHNDDWLLDEGNAPGPSRPGPAFEGGEGT